MKGPIVNGKQYNVVVLRPVEWDEQGRPTKVIVGYDNEKFRLDDPNLVNEFYTAFVPEKMTEPKARNN